MLNWPATLQFPGVGAQLPHPPTPQLPGVGVQDPHPSGPPIEDFDTSIPEGIIDRMLQARPNHFDKAVLAEARKWIHGYQAKFGRAPNPHPPDDYLLAQLLTVAPSGQLVRVEGRRRIQAQADDSRRLASAPGRSCGRRIR